MSQTFDQQNSPMSTSPGHQNAWPLHLLIAIGSVAATAAIGNIVTLPFIPTWYAGLAKPDFNPPNWIFGPVWTLLYVLMAIAFYRVLRLSPSTEGRTEAITEFAIQLVFNAFWTVAFFGLQSPGAGLVVMTLLWLAIVANIARFTRLDHIAAVLLVPYIVWVSFAALLNVAIFRLN